MISELPFELRGLAIGYRTALASNINLQIKPREFVTLMGENGAGKTTLIDCLTGCLDPLAGDIRFWGHRNRGECRLFINQNVGWVSSQKENYPLYMNVADYFKSISTLLHLELGSF